MSTTDDDPPQSQQKIESIDRETVHRICSGQVVVDLKTAVKELVENALDAGAKSVVVRLKDYGAEEIEVTDDGHGVDKSNFSSLCTRHATSKISSFDDLNGVASFGFRGEALSSLCALSDNVEVRTRTVSEAVGSRLMYDQRGQLVSNTPMARPVGTSVVIRELFKTQPVRRVQFRKHLKRQYAQLLSVLQSYALISKTVRFTCTNKASNKSRTTSLSTNGSLNMKGNIASVFGVKFLKSLRPFEMKIRDGEDETTNLEGSEVVGYVSKMSHGITMSNTSRQIMFVNGRPTNLPKMTKLINRTWRQFDMTHKPAFILDIRLPPGQVDVNVTPDKRTLLIVNEALLLTRLGRCLSELWEPSRYTYKVRSIEDSLRGAVAVNEKKVVDGKISPVAGDETALMTTSSQDSEDKISRSNSTTSDTVSIGMSSSQDSEIGRTMSRSSSSTRDVIRSGPVPDQPSEEERNKSVVMNRSSVQKATTSTETRALRTPVNDGGLMKDQGNVNAMAPIESSSPSPTLHVVTTENRPTTNKTKAPRMVNDTAAQAGDDARDKSMDRKTPKKSSSVSELLLASKSSSNLSHAMMSAASAGLTSAAVAISRTGQRDRRGTKRTYSFRDRVVSSPMCISTSDTSSWSNRMGHVCGPQCHCGGEWKGYTVNVESKRPLSLQSKTTEPPSPVSITIDALRRHVRAQMKTKEDTGSSSDHCKEKSNMFDGLGTDHADETGRKDVEKRFERVFDKANFGKMKPLGQFNLGFIIARLNDDLFILDQHACDEKYNFERLHRDAKKHSQPLIRPRTLHVSANDEMTIAEHIELFRANGFDLDLDESAPVGQRVKLKGMSHCMGASFGVDDILEYASILQDWTPVAGNLAPRLPKLDRLFASRACRSSIMIGTALDIRLMTRTVRNLEHLDQPWNCPVRSYDPLLFSLSPSLSHTWFAHKHIRIAHSFSTVVQRCGILLI